jgi:hypothetical protein
MACFFRGFEFVRNFFTPSASRAAFGELRDEKICSSQIFSKSQSENETMFNPWHPCFCSHPPQDRSAVVVPESALTRSSPFLPFGSTADLKAGILRHVSPAFVEDPLRVLRVARFAARFGFAVAPETLTLMAEIVTQGKMEQLVAERAWSEIERALAEARPRRFFEVLRECRALGRLLPEIDALFGVPQRADYHPEHEQRGVALSGRCASGYAHPTHSAAWPCWSRACTAIVIVPPSCARPRCSRCSRRSMCSAGRNRWSYSCWPARRTSAGASAMSRATTRRPHARSMPPRSRRDRPARRPAWRSAPRASRRFGKRAEPAERGYKR